MTGWLLFTFSQAVMTGSLSITGRHDGRPPRRVTSLTPD